jgi:hypothetical protein
MPALTLDANRRVIIVSPRVRLLPSLILIDRRVRHAFATLNRKVPRR